MTIEAPNPPNYISDLDDTYPASGDSRTEGDDHIRNIKTALAGSFPNFAGAAVTATEAELNYLDGPSPGSPAASKALILDANYDIHLQPNGGDIDCVTLDASGNVDLGSATSNTVTVAGKFDSHLIPSGTRNLGGNTTDQAWQYLYIDGRIYIDANYINEWSKDGTMAGNSDIAVPTEKAVKTYADSIGYNIAVRESVSGSAAKTTTTFSGTIDQISIAVENLKVSSAGAFISIKIGDSGGIESSGYRGSIGQHDGRSAMGGGSGPARDGAYWNINENSMGTSDIAEGVITLSRCNGNVWSFSYSGYMHDNGSYSSWIVGGGSKSLSGALDRVQIATTAGTFSSGSWKVSYTRSA